MKEQLQWPGSCDVCLWYMQTWFTTQPELCIFTNNTSIIHFPLPTDLFFYFLFFFQQREITLKTCFNVIHVKLPWQLEIVTRSVNKLLIWIHFKIITTTLKWILIASMILAHTPGSSPLLWSWSTELRFSLFELWDDTGDICERWVIFLINTKLDWQRTGRLQMAYLKD